MACILAVVSLLASFTMINAHYSYSPQYILQQHNIFRCMHGVPALVWNQNTVANAAQAWANRIRDRMQHGGMQAGRYQLGQNLWMAWNSGSVNANLCVQNWYNEIRYTPGGQGAERNINGQTGHYTQVVWASTKVLGCGRWCGLSQGMHCCQVVCDYYPAGNAVGFESYNVFPIQKSLGQCMREVELQMLANNATIPEELPEIFLEHQPTSWMQECMSRLDFGSSVVAGMFIAVMVTVVSYFMKRRANNVKVSPLLG